MSLAAGWLAEIARDGPAVDLWLEIEGIRWAFGLTARSSSWFDARYAQHRRLGILGVLAGPPAGVEQEARPFDADSSVGQLTAQITLDSGGIVAGLYSGVGRSDGWLRLSADMGTPAAYGGTLESVALSYTKYLGSADPGVGDVLYCGRETWLVGSVGYVSRCLAAPPTSLDRLAYLHTAGDVISPYPRFLATRRAFLYSAPFNGTDADKVLRWAGTITNAKLNKLTGLELTMESLASDLANAKRFTQQIRGKLGAGITAPDGSYTNQSDEDPAALNRKLRVEPTSLAGRAWTAGQRVVVQVGDELISGRLRTSAEGFANEIHFDGTDANDGRSLFGTQGVQHNVGDEVIEVVPILGYNAAGSVEERVSRFTKGDNPIDVALQLLLSKDGDGTNGTWDVLPFGLGLGLDQARVDVTGIAAMRDRWLAVARDVRLITEPFSPKELIASLLQPQLCYPVVQLNDVLTFRFLGPPMPDTTPRAVSGTHIIGIPGWTANIDHVVGRLLVSVDYDPLEQRYRQQYRGEFSGPGNEAQEFYAGKFETLTLEFRGQWSGNDAGSAKWGARLFTDAENTALRYFDLVRDRLARPFPTIDVECQYDVMDVEVGDLLAVTVDGVPNILTGAASLSGAICEVRRKVIDDRRGVVTLSLVQTGYRQRQRLIGPCAVVNQATSGDFCHVYPDVFSTGTDDVAFQNGDAITIWSGDLYTNKGSRLISGGTGSGIIAWIGQSSIAVVVGDVVMLADYATQTAQRVIDRNAFLAGAGTLPLLNSAAFAHEYTP